MSKRFIFLIIFFISLGGCSSEGARKLPGVYRIDVQQGNVIEQEMLDKLKPGMAKQQVHFIMGTPTIVDPFRKDRWEYIYTFSKGGKRRQQRHITIYFEEDKLAYLDGGVVLGIRRPPEEYVKQRKTVDVPDRTKKEGFFSKLVNVIPFVGDDEPKRIEKSESDDTYKEDEETTETTDEETTSNTEEESEASATP